jgi:TRAP-type C4-dicarboxylate transport system permease small subunit
MLHDTLATVVRVMDRAFLIVAAVGLIAMMLHISADILMSLIFNAPIATTSAIVTSYYMIAVAFLPILAAEYRGNQISVSLLTDLLSQHARYALGTLVMAVTAAAYILLTMQSWQQATEKLAIGAFVVEQTSRIPVWPAFFMLPLAFGAMALLLVLKVAGRMTGGPVIAAPGSPEIIDAEVRNV